MKVIPAIDLLGGKVVRLEKGKEESAIVYSNDPVRIAKLLFGSTADVVHVVDLDAAFGKGSNMPLVKEIAEYGKVQLGGGIRNANSARLANASGVDQVIIGSALSDQATVRSIKSAFKKSVLAGLDFSKDGELLSKGWTKISGKISFEDLGLDGIVATSTDADGTLGGIDLKLYPKLSRFDCPKTYAGGIASEKDLGALERQGWDYAIVGKALYEGAIPLENLKEWF